MGTFGNSADEMGKWNSNKEMDISANSSLTESGLLESEEQGGEQSWREDDDTDTQLEDPATATEKAED